MLAAGAIALLVLERLFPGHALGYGFPRFLEMVHLEGGRVKRRWMIVKTLGAAISLGAGASVGREGPIAQIGGSIGSFVAQLLRLESRLKLLVACGAAAGIATTFNAPIGSVMFAQEIVLQGKVELAHFSLIVISTATAVIASRALGGTETVFHARTFELGGYQEILTYARDGARARRARRRPTCDSSTPRSSASRASEARHRDRSSSAASCWSASSASFLPQNLSDGYPVINDALAGTLADRRSW